MTNAKQIELQRKNRLSTEMFLALCYIAQDHSYRAFTHGRTLKALCRRRFIVLDDGSRWEVDDIDASTSESWSEMDRAVVIDGEMYRLDETPEPLPVTQPNLS